jgi:hypothetical protein
VERNSLNGGFMAKEPDDNAASEVYTEETETEESTEETEETEESTEEAEETDAEESEETESEDTGEQSSSRRESRNARQARENRELREKLARTEGERDSLKAPKPPVDTAEARRLREEKLALMSPEERMAFEAKEEVGALRNEARTTQMLLLDMQDRNSYEIMCTNDPVASKYKAEVEQLLVEMRKNGSTAPRETLLNYVIGKHARESAKKGGAKRDMKQRREQANERVNQSKSKPTSARGGASGTSKGGDDVDSLRQRILDREERGDVN